MYFARSFASPEEEDWLTLPLAETLTASPLPVALPDEQVPVKEAAARTALLLDAPIPPMTEAPTPENIARPMDIAAIAAIPSFAFVGADLAGLGLSPFLMALRAVPSSSWLPSEAAPSLPSPYDGGRLPDRSSKSSIPPWLDEARSSSGSMPPKSVYSSDTPSDAPPIPNESAASSMPSLEMPTSRLSGPK